MSQRFLACTISGVRETRAIPQPEKHSLSPVHDSLLSTFLDPQRRKVIRDARWRSKLPQPKLSDGAYDLTNVGGHSRHEIIVLYQKHRAVSIPLYNRYRAPRADSPMSSQFANTYGLYVVGETVIPRCVACSLRRRSVMLWGYRNLPRMRTPSMYNFVPVAKARSESW